MLNIRKSNSIVYVKKYTDVWDDVLEGLYRKIFSEGYKSETRQGSVPTSEIGGDTASVVSSGKGTERET